LACSAGSLRWGHGFIVLVVCLDDQLDDDAVLLRVRHRLFSSPGRPLWHRAPAAGRSTDSWHTAPTPRVIPVHSGETMTRRSALARLGVTGLVATAMRDPDRHRRRRFGPPRASRATASSTPGSPRDRRAGVRAVRLGQSWRARGRARGGAVSSSTRSAQYPRTRPNPRQAITSHSRQSALTPGAQ